MDFKNFAFKLITLVLMSCIFSSCAYKSLRENLKDLQDKKVAAVITKCRYIYNEPYIIFARKNMEVPCTTSWVGQNNGFIYADSDAVFKNEVYFVQPDNYLFANFRASFGDYVITYNNVTGELPSMFTNFTVSGGDVVYIGDIVVDSRKSDYVLQAMNVEYASDLEIDKRLSHKYPFLKDKVQKRLIKVRPANKLLRDILVAN